jgi:hypothetical protein
LAGVKLIEEETVSRDLLTALKLSTRSNFGVQGKLQDADGSSA